MSEVPQEDPYTCIGVCMADPDSGLCQGCGRPLQEPESAEPTCSPEPLAPIAPGGISH